MWELSEEYQPRPPNWQGSQRGGGGERVDWARPFRKEKKKYICDHFLKAGAEVCGGMYINGVL